jgi:hypothetical protein
VGQNGILTAKFIPARVIHTSLPGLAASFQPGKTFDAFSFIEHVVLLDDCERCWPIILPVSG